MTASLLFFIVAAVLCGCAAFNVPSGSRVSLFPLGVMFLSLAFIVTGYLGTK